MYETSLMDNFGILQMERCSKKPTAKVEDFALRIKGRET